MHSLMPQALRVLGVCHAIHNCSENLNTALSQFDDFLGKLKLLHKFLGQPKRRGRFVEVVLQGKPAYNVVKPLFASFSGTLYEHRWGEVASYLKKAQSLFVCLKMH